MSDRSHDSAGGDIADRINARLEARGFERVNPVLVRQILAIAATEPDGPSHDRASDKPAPHEECSCGGMFWHREDGSVTCDKCGIYATVIPGVKPSDYPSAPESSAGRCLMTFYGAGTNGRQAIERRCTGRRGHAGLCRWNATEEAEWSVDDKTVEPPDDWCARLVDEGIASGMTESAAIVHALKVVSANGWGCEECGFKLPDHHPECITLVRDELVDDARGERQERIRAVKEQLRKDGLTTDDGTWVAAAVADVAETAVHALASAPSASPSAYALWGPVIAAVREWKHALETKVDIRPYDTKLCDALARYDATAFPDRPADGTSTTPQEDR